MEWDDEISDFMLEAAVEKELLRLKAQAKARAILAGGNADSWATDVDVATLTDPESPSLFWRANTDGTFRGYGYPGGLHLLYGARKSGKTMLAYAWAAQELSQGHGVLWFAFERQQGVRERLRLAGVTDLSRLKYRYASGLPDARQVQMLAETAAADGVSLVVFDAFRGLQSAVAPGTSANDGDSVEVVNQRVLMPFQAAGIAVLVIDHTAKAGGNASAFGSERKESMADVVLAVECLRQFNRETEGWSKVAVSDGADRYGYNGSDAPGYLVVSPGRGIQFREDVPVGPAIVREDDEAVKRKQELRRARELEVWKAVLLNDDWTANALGEFLHEHVGQTADVINLSQSKWRTLIAEMKMCGQLRYAFGNRNSRLLRPGPGALPDEVRPMLADPDVAARLERYSHDLTAFT